MSSIVYAGIGVIAALAAYYMSKARALKLIASAKHKQHKLIHDAKEEVAEILERGKDMGEQIRSRSKDEVEADDLRLKNLEDDLKIQDNILQNKMKHLKESEDKIGVLEETVSKFEKNLDESKESVAKLVETRAGVTRSQVTEEITNNIVNDFYASYQAFVKKYEDVVKEGAEDRAKKIVLGICHKYKDKMPYRKNVTFTVKWRNERNRKRFLENKGWVITYLEKKLNTNCLFDEENRQIVCAGPHLYRNAVAQGALQKILRHRGKVDERSMERAMKQTEDKLEKQMIIDADEALKVAKIRGIDDDFKKIIGKLKFRTSYGQNILNHAAEAGQIAAMVAYEIGADVSVSRLGGFLHDVGKALDHDLGGTHIELSTEMADRFGLSDETVHAIEAHHEDVEIKSVEALLVQTGDAISSSRPGARQEFLEKYLERIRALESTVKEFKGVDHAYAIQAGREIRVAVNSKIVTEETAPALAHDIAEKIESTLAYPGYVQVSLIRETEVVEYARAK